MATIKTAHVALLCLLANTAHLIPINLCPTTHPIVTHLVIRKVHIMKTHEYLKYFHLWY